MGVGLNLEPLSYSLGLDYTAEVEDVIEAVWDSFEQAYDLLCLAGIFANCCSLSS
jgi:ABC-type multidrug transport system permease subunit